MERSAEQCRLKIKKLRQQYIKVRDTLRKSGSSGEERDKLISLDVMDREKNQPATQKTWQSRPPRHLLHLLQATRTPEEMEDAADTPTEYRAARRFLSPFYVRSFPKLSIQSNSAPAWSHCILHKPHYIHIIMKKVRESTQLVAAPFLPEKSGFPARCA